MIIADPTYRKSFIIALMLHVMLAIALLIDTTTNQRPVLTPDAKNEPSEALPIDSAKPQPEIVKAVSVNQEEVMATVSRLKQEHANQLKAEQARQQALAKQAEAARQARLQEQKHLAQLKEEAEKIAIARKKQIEEEKRHLQELAQEKANEAKRLAELKAKQEKLKKEQQEEAEKLAQLKQKQVEEKLKADKLKIEKANEEALNAKEEERLKREKLKEEQTRAEKAKAELAEKNRQAAIKQAAADAAKSAHLAGEVNKYKALIVNAISRQWILPENIDHGLSSQFRIRLAPDGAVLEVSLTRSSGDAVLDRSAQTAIYKASPLPVPHDPQTFDLFRDISLTVRPENVRG